MPQFSDDLFLGTAVSGAVNTDGPSPVDVGVGPMGRVYLFDVVPTVIPVAGLSTAAAVGSGASLVLKTATGITSRVRADGTTEYVFDVPRSCSVTAAGANTATYTITGYDQYGQRMSQTIAAPSTSTVNTTKMFKTIISITNANATIAGSNISASFGDLIGLPIRMIARDYSVGCNFNATAVALTAITVADVTSPATTATTDVRGYVTLPTASDSTKRLIVAIGVPAIAAGPNATRIGAYGVTQV
jgi:hypothetical protein